MSANLPCPCCGTEHGPEETACRVCEYEFGATVAPADPKCSRCGAHLHPGFEFCQVCGLKLTHRHRRPATRGISVRTLGSGDSVSGPHGFRSESGPQAASPAPGPAPAASPAPAPMAAPAFAPAMAPGVAPAAAARPQRASEIPTRAPERPARASGPMAAPVHHAPPASGPAPVAAAAPASSVPTPIGQAAPVSQVAPAPAPQAGGFNSFAQASGVSMPIPLRVVCVARDGTEGASHVVGETPLEIGRGTAIAYPNDPFISPHHCRISRMPDGGLHLLDLGSRNGVYVRILAPEQVYPGDLFLLGHQLLRLDNLPGDNEERPADIYGVRGFGTPLQPGWGMLVSLGVGDVEADRHFLRGNQVVFGRESGDILFPSDGFLSRQHARLRMELRGSAMDVLLEDLGSANGTYLRMRKEAVLGPGDMFRVGDQIFRVRSE